MKLVPYAPTIGSLMYVMVMTRPNIAHAVGVVSRFMHNPGRPDWNAIKNVFRYLVGTQDLGILLGPNKNLGVVGYTYSNFADCVDNRKSTTLQIRQWSNLVEVNTSGMHDHFND